ncbi:hypothetical protein TAMA11512_05740 [Selenomonas sp. TAMA-11512]|uniref:hypothetical protein n=1 Tax=Selenomonas sp. TAMA-11512 TaxID=3095337 RepID=UPI00309163FF|nr:hypothetical protein TAMA11512_05740 [Selenomonas sp. TAMA-11512]
MAEAITGAADTNMQQISASAVKQKVQTQLAEARAVANRQETARAQSAETPAAEVNLTDHARIYGIEQKVNSSQDLTSDEMNYIRVNDTDLYDKALREQEALAAEEAGTAVSAPAEVQ